MKNRITGFLFGLTAVASLALVMLHAIPAHSYLPQGLSSGTTFVNDTWGTVPIAVAISDSIPSGAKLQGTATFVSVIQNSLATWQGAPNFKDPIGTVTVNSHQTVQGGENLICFCTSGAVFTPGDGTLAVTITTLSGTNIIGANIFFNPQPTNLCFATDSTVTTCSTSTDAVQDLETVATHELGHLFGLDHSAVVRATMYPFAPAKETTLSWDDVAGASLLYPKSAADVATGSISGNVSLTGAVFGAHVFANPTGTTNPFGAFPNIRKSPVSMLTDPNGNYTIHGLPPDDYIVLAEPLDLPVDNTNVSWAGEWGVSGLDTGFTTRFH